MNTYNHGSSSTRPNVKFCFERTNTCLQPVQVAASDITTNSATVSWMPGNSETAWQYAYSDSVMSNEVLATAATDINSMNVSLSGLLGDKDYHFYVRANCGEESYSDWSHVMFPTQLSCERPVSVTAEAEDNSIAFAAYAGVTGSPEGMTLRYWTVGSEPVEVAMTRNDRYDTTWTLTDPAEVASVDTVVRFVATVENLIPITFYHYQVQTLCLATEGNSRWTVEDSVRTLCDGTVTLPYTEDFKATSLNRDCWTAEILDDNAAMPYFGANGLYLNGSYTSSVNGDRYFISPRFNAEDTLVWKHPVEDFNKINSELKEYSAELSTRPQIVVGNKADLVSDEEQENITRLKAHVEALGYSFFVMSAATHSGTEELIRTCAEMLTTLPIPKAFEADYVPPEPEIGSAADVEIQHFDDIWTVEGPWMQRLCATVNFSDHESMMFFDRALRTSGIYARMEEMGVKDGDTVSIYDLMFEYKD